MGSVTPPWRIYERFIASLQSEKASDHITVVPNARLIGSITGVERQVDALIDARLEENVTRRVIVDAKLRKRKIDVKDVEAFEGMMKDCRASRGILVCSNGSTETAQRRAQEAITISLVGAEQLETLDLRGWDPCLGTCAEPGSARESGWVLYHQPFGFWTATSPLTVLVVGKCDGCGDFHVWCWECGRRFALCGEEAEYKCDCDRFWITAREDEGLDDRGNVLESILLMMIPLNVVADPIVVDRRPLR